MRDTILSKLKPVRQRQLLVAAIQGALQGLLIGAIAAILVAILRLNQIGGATTLGGVSVLITVPLLSAIVAGMWRLMKSDWRNAARAVDQSYELKDRTETALAFLTRQDAHKAGELEVLQLADAVHHLQRVEPRTVVPVELPATWRWAAATATLAVILLGWPTARALVNAGPSQPIDAIVTEAEIVVEDLQSLLDQLPEDHDPEIDALIKELQAKANEMKEPGVDVREALAKVSEMQAALQAVAAQFNVAATDEQMQAIGEALQSAEALQQAGQALQDGNYEKATEELAKLENPKLDRKESRAVSDKLQKASESSAQSGLKKLSDATKEISEGMKNDNSSQSKSGTSKLAECAKQQGNNKKIGNMLKKQCDKLGECKGNCQGNSSGNKMAKNPSLKAGKGTNSETQGERTNLAAKRNEQKLQGLKGEQGDSDKETITTPEAEETAKRGLKEVYSKYRKMSDAVLDSEDIPLGHRQTIRRYFEAIRPNAEDAAVEASSKK